VFLIMSDNGTIGKLVTAWIGILVVILIAFGLLAHSEIGRHRARVVRVFDLSREYRVSLRPTNAQFSNRWNEYLNDSVDPYNGGNLDEQAYSDLVNRFLAADSNRDNYETLAGFYESVGDCVDVGLCDFWFARTVFGNDIVTFYHNMYPALEAESQQGQNIQGILNFVDRMRDADKGQSRPGWEDNLTARAY
jgi:hypothetical protein